MNKTTLVFLLCFTSKVAIGQILVNGQISVNGQMPALDVVGSGTGMAGYAGFLEISPALKKQKKTLDYQDVEGTCFWDDRWNPALLLFKDGHKMKLKQVRLDSYSNEIHYLDASKEEFVLQKGVIPKISFLNPTDTSKVTAVFQVFDNIKEAKGAYLKILNDGNAQILKWVSTSVKKGDYNQFRAKAVFCFVQRTTYFIRQGNTVASLKKISQNSVGSVITLDDACLTWLKSNENKLKSENELLEFFAFYNARKKS